MSNNGLTQDEIDALLAGTADIVDKPISSSGTQSVTADKINTSELSNFIDIWNNSLQYQTNQFTNTYHKNLLYSSVRAKIRDSSTIANELQGKLVQIRTEYDGGISGECVFVLKHEDAIRFGEIITGQSNLEMNESTLTILNEAFAMMLTVSNDVLARKFNRAISSQPPQIEILENSSQVRFPSVSQVVHITYNLNPENTSPIPVTMIMSVPMIKEIINLSRGTVDGPLDYMSGIGADGERDYRAQINVRPVQYSGFEEALLQESPGSINLLVDIFMQITVELGRTKMQIKEILGLSEGSIIELEKLAGEPVDLLVNGRLIAKGEVVVIDESFGVRVTEIVSASDRIET